MKKILAILALTVASALFAAEAPATDQRTVLSTVTANGVTTTLYIGRVQSDPAKDGTATLTVYPDKVITDSAGNVLSSGFTEPFTVALTQQQYAGVSSLIKATYLASQSTP